MALLTLLQRLIFFFYRKNILRPFDDETPLVSINDLIKIKYLSHNDIQQVFLPIKNGPGTNSIGKNSIEI